MHILRTLFVALAFAATARTQSTTSNNLGTLPVGTALKGFGVVINDPTQDWEFRLAAAKGASNVRFQCGWDITELQTSANTSAGLALPASCAAGLLSARVYGLSVTVLAAFGPAVHDRYYVTVPAGAPAGASSFTIHFGASPLGDTRFSRLLPFYDYFYGNGSQVTAINAGASGALITAVTPNSTTDATISLSSPLTVPLQAGTTYFIRERLYVPPADFNPTDPSTLRYAAYAQFLAHSIAMYGLKGEVEIWNEAPWSDDPWDVRQNFFSTFKAPSTGYGPTVAGLPNFGFAAAIQALGPPPPGVSYLWGGTEKSGSNTLTDAAQMATQTHMVLLEPSAIFRSESFHPYGAWPEQVAWSNSCLFSATTANYGYCSLNLSSDPGNFITTAFNNVRLRKILPINGLGMSLTETGLALSTTDLAHQARFELRQLLGYNAAGVTPVNFYAMLETSADNFSLANANGTAKQALNDIAAYLALLGRISNAPVSYTAASLATPAYLGQGTYPLNYTHVLGRATAWEAHNSDVLTMWQGSSGMNWKNASQPAAAWGSVVVPAEYSVVSATNLVTQTPVSYTLSGQKLTLAVSDDPISLLIAPN